MGYRHKEEKHTYAGEAWELSKQLRSTNMIVWKWIQMFKYGELDTTQRTRKRRKRVRARKLKLVYGLTQNRYDKREISTLQGETRSMHSSTPRGFTCLRVLDTE